MHSQYYQGILQMRPASKEQDDYVMALVGSHLSKRKKVRNGIDYYLKSNTFLQQLAKRLMQDIGGTLSFASTLHTRDRQSGKELYRVTALFKPHPFIPGAVVAAGNNVFVVSGSSGKKQTVTNLVTGKKQVLPEGAVQIATHRVVVSKHVPFLEVIDPETFQSVPLQNLKSTTRKTLVVAKHAEKLYAVTKGG